MDDFISHYKILEKIGEGSFSDVIKCEHKVTKTFYAAKRLRKRFQNFHSALECAEIIATKKLKTHPNVLCMQEYYYNKSTKYMTFIFELMDTSVYELLQRCKSFSSAKARFYLYQILKGLDHIHGNGLFHRDIKPENILLRLGNNSFMEDLVKIADLGSIRGIYSRKPYTEYISTRWYRSPECLLTNGFYGSKMDVWAAGCVFYEMLTTKPLFPGFNEIDQLDKIHGILGTPTNSTLVKFRKNKSGNFINFTPRVGVGLHSLLPSLSKDEVKVLAAMLKYDPVLRSNVKRLLALPYFHKLNQNDLENKYKPSYTEKFEIGKGDGLGNIGMYQTKPPIARYVSDKSTTSMINNYDNQGTEFRKCTQEPSSECIKIKTKGAETQTPPVSKNVSNGAISVNIVKRKLSQDSRGSERNTQCKKGLFEKKHCKTPTASLILPRPLLGVSNSITITDFKSNVIILNANYRGNK